MMDKEKIAERIKELIKEYKLKKESLENYKKEFEKLGKSRKVRKYIELAENINNSNKDLNSIILEISELEKKFKESEDSIN